MGRIKHIFLLIISISFSLYAQDEKGTSDYLKKAHDKYHERIDKLSELASVGDSVEFFKLHHQLRKIALKENDAFLLVYTNEKKGVWFYYTGKPRIALCYFDSALTIAKKNRFNEIIASTLMNIGSTHYTLQNYTEALNHYKACEEIMTKYNSSGLTTVLGNISLLYQEIGDLENAKKYLHRSFPFVKRKKEKDAYVKALNNLGLISKKENNLKAADSLFRLGYDLCKSNNLRDDFADVLYNLISLLYMQKKFEEALPLNNELLAHVRKYKDPSWVKLVLLDEARINFYMGNLGASKKALEESEKIAFGEDALDRDEESSFLYAAELYYNLKLYEKAATAFTKYFKIHEQSQNENEVMNMQQVGFKFEKRQDSLTNEKEKEIALIENLREQEKAENTLRQQRIIIIVSLLGIVFVIIFLFFLIKANRNKEKANKEISYQRGLLTEKNKEITDSITYAKRIQHSLLTPKDLIDILLPDHFLLYMPKDIVSGDFYWVKRLNTNEILVAVADCTGHGVPGAMMSALSIQTLNELSIQTHSPSKLLTLLNNNLKNTLNQEQEGFSKDGLDIGLCKINVKERKVNYSGANRSLQIYNKGGLKQEIKPTKTGIAGHTEMGQIYQEHEVIFEADDMAVMSTDGFADQFGGAENKKITTKRFKQWITEIISIADKKDELEKRFAAWKKSTDQIDDVCVLGFKI